VLTLVLGGTRSGKSEVAEGLALRTAAARALPVTYVATARETDPDMAERISAHRARRPPEWQTAPAGELSEQEWRTWPGVVLLDSLGVWLAGRPDFVFDPALADRAGHRPEPTIVVSDEVGLGVHPSSASGRAFRDALGQLNRLMADRADRVLLVVAGRVLPLEAPA
jgi:adenosyl cobinamide kinase/adenosyl cobinamide phosphate guanylyltransferase